MNIPIYGFWHIYPTDIGKEIAVQQMERLVKSGLYDKTKHLFAGCVKHKPPLYAEKLTCFIDDHFNTYEGFTLTMLYLHAITLGKDEAYYYYFHTKGASRSVQTPNLIWWRNEMEKCLFDNHEWCLKQLVEPEVTTTGPLFFIRDQPFWAGNFWFTKASYVRRCESPYEFAKRVCSPEIPMRFYYENWITQSIQHQTVTQRLEGMRPYSFWREGKHDD